jgi:Exopolyphosphatase
MAVKKNFFQNTPSRLAAIDIGTNSFHLVVVEWNEEGKVRVLDRAKEYVRLGSGGKDMKLLTQAAMDRGLRVLHTFNDIAKVNQAPVRAIATSAVREALNQKEFIDRVRKETGIHIEVVSGLEEARLIYLGVLNAVPVFNKKILLMDIGGGSVEYLIGYRGEMLYAASLKLGAIRLTNRFFKNPDITKKDILACSRHIRGFLSHVESEVKKISV